VQIRTRKGKKGTTRYLDYRINGKRIVESLGNVSKHRAELIAAERKMAIAEGRHVSIKEYKKVMFYDICEEFLSWSRLHKKSYKRDIQLINNLKRFFGNIPLHAITRQRAENYQSWRVQQVSKATTNREIAALKRIWNRAVEQRKAAVNPISKIKMFPEPRTIRFFTESELEKLITHAPDNLRPFIIVAVLTGMREGELRTLKWKNVNFDFGLLRLEDSKSGKPREIPMSDTVKKVLWELRKASQGKKDYVFLNERGQPYRKIRIDKTLKQIGIKDANLHTLRHTAATNLIKANINLKVIQSLLGHADIATTMRYAHLVEGEVAKAVQILDAQLKTVTLGKKLVKNSESAKTKKDTSSKVLKNKG